jgi:hypothetical protein
VNYFDPLRTFFLVRVCNPHIFALVMRHTHTLNLNQGNLPAWSNAQAERLAKLRTFQAGGWTATGSASAARKIKSQLRDAGLSGDWLDRTMFDIFDLARLIARAA